MHGLILLLAVITTSALVTMKIEMHDPNGACKKYVEKGLDYLEIKYARILMFENADKKQLSRPARIPKNTIGHSISLAVAPKKQMMLGPIDYRYQEESMKLVENGFLDVDALNSQSFQPNQHISVKNITIYDLKGPGWILDHDFDSCQGFWPRRLIGDHGVYMSVQSKSLGYGWLRMYFDPSGIGEEMVWIV
ncbi:Protein CBG05411 [Caenorhabditis briggsae]|uniref:Protein CBG05411 n=1 Tax=Caenorhabditis briggsae TaxID=6238 RepID=A8WZT6_CAEBR|nr:Protein CBG05411 [Caenorhabditis briggsae]CAP25896.1 Protein CBG05411 [Caenorhabditis briggsae]